MFIQLNEATNHTVNHGELSTLSKGLKGGGTYYYNYIHVYTHVQFVILSSQNNIILSSFFFTFLYNDFVAL